MPDINALLWPKSVAVIGASPDPHILRGRLMSVLGCHPFPGRIIPISRSHDEINGLKTYPSISAVGEPVDLAVLIIPAPYVADTLRECGENGVRAAAIITSGFAEEHSDSGDDMQDEIREIALQYDMAVCGPNSEGFANLLAPLCATFSPAVDDPNMALLPARRDEGVIAVVAQSGGIGFSFFDRGRPKELPFGYIVTTGNEACLGSLDIVDHMLDDGRAEVFLLFLEDIKDPARFQPVAEKALKAGKPIIVAKIGRSDAGRRAAASHTAALAGSYAGYQAMFRRYGVIEGFDSEEIVDIASGFSYFRNRLPKGRRVGIVTGSGGGGGWMADSCAAAGLVVPELDAATRALIDPHLPSYGTSQNPVDATAQAIRQLGYSTLGEMVAGSDEVDAVVIVTTARNVAPYERERETLVRVAAETEKPIVLCSYTLPNPASVALLAEAGFPLYTNMRNTARAVAAMADYREARDRFLRTPAIDSAPAVGGAFAAASRVLCEYEAKPLLAAYGMRFAQEHLADSAEAAVDAAKRTGGPVALKVQSPDILHKTEAGSVVLGVEGEADVAAAYQAILAAAKRYDSNADIRGVLVQPMAPRGREMILGINRDETFGPMLMVGFGGIYVEVTRDVALSPLPVGPEEARAMVSSLRGAALLGGVRGEAPADVDALVEAMVALSRFAVACGDRLAEVDLNPVLVHAQGKGVSIVDALIVKTER